VKAEADFCFIKNVFPSTIFSVTIEKRKAMMYNTDNQTKNPI